MPPWSHHSVSSYAKRDADANGGITLPIVFSMVTAAVFAVFFFTLYKSRRSERADALKKRQDEAREEGAGDGLYRKAELSGGSSVVIHEMDSQRQDQELPDRKEGMPHELPEVIVPQELPAALNEMPVEESSDDQMSKARRQSMETQSILNHTSSLPDKPLPVKKDRFKQDRSGD